MVTYQQLYLLVGLNIGLVILFVIFANVWKKATGVTMALLSICWLASSWYYQLRLADHLPADLGDHVFLSLFLTVVFGFGCVLSIFAVFVFGSIAISSALHSDGSQKKDGPNHSPLPLWIVSLAVGLLSVWILNKNMIPQLTRLMDQIIDLIYVKLFQSKAQFVSSYIPVAGIAAGSIVPFCLNKLYRNSRVPFLYYPFVVLVPALTAVLAPLVDLLGCVLVIVLAYAAYCEKDEYSSDKRHAWLYFLMALGVGALSGLYFYVNDLTILGDDKALTLVGGLASGFTIACLGFKSYSDVGSPLPSLFLLGLIPYCTPGFGSAIAFIINIVAAIVMLIVGSTGKGSKEIQGPLVNPLDPNAHIILSDNGEFITLNDHGRTVIAVAHSVYANTYIDNSGRLFRKEGDYAILVR